MLLWSGLGEVRWGWAVEGCQLQAVVPPLTKAGVCRAHGYQNSYPAATITIWRPSGWSSWPPMLVGGLWPHCQLQLECGSGSHVAVLGQLL